ncbi:MAG: asparagine synthase-related protein [Melioribacteraceae bacterium]
MSWIIGASGNFTREQIEKIKRFNTNSNFQINEPNLFVIAGGNIGTLFFSETNSENKFIAVGIGIKDQLDQTKFLTANDWGRITNEEEIQGLNGHFVLLRWNNNEIKIFTDSLGLRDIYITRLANGVVLFSTRADWIAKIIKAKLNFKEFGSRWLLFNQISSKSVFENIERITVGTKVNINRLSGEVTTSKFNWQPTFTKIDYPVLDFSKTLNDFIFFPLINQQKLSLSLSGGMDSRVILSYLLNSKYRDWYTHTFGDGNHPDSLVAKKITSNLGVTHEGINMSLPEGDSIIQEIADYVSGTLVNNAASGFLQLRNYNKLVGRNEIIIDGGFGEIWRREFFNRLLITGQKALINNNAKEIIPYLTIHRANIFNEDVRLEMLCGCEEQINNIFSELPRINEIGIENWVDLFAIKTRLVNYYSHEQTRLDSLVMCYMPFAQPFLLDNIFNISIEQRKNGKMFRKLIRNNYSPLLKYPLAKGQLSHPFWLNTIQSRIWNIAYKKLRLKTYRDNSSERLINSLKTFINDSINSASTKEAGIYDNNKLINLSQSLHTGDATAMNIHELDWWLAFELFRKSVTR